MTTRDENTDRIHNDFRNCFDDCSDAIIVCDGFGNILYTNVACTSLLGHSLEELEGKPESVLLPKGQPPIPTETIAQTPNGCWEGDVLRMRKDGEVFHAHAKMWLTRDKVDGQTAAVSLLRRAAARSEDDTTLTPAPSRPWEPHRPTKTGLAMRDVYEAFSTHIGELIPNDRIGIVYVDSAKRSHSDVYAAGVQISETADALNTPLRGTLTEAIANSHDAIIFDPTATGDLPLTQEHMLPFLQAGLRSVLAAPLVSNGATVGILYVASLLEDAYTRSDLVVIERLGVRLAETVATFHLRDSLDREVHKQGILAAIGRIVTSSPDIYETMDRFAESLQAIIPFDAATIGTFDSEEGTVTFNKSLFPPDLEVSERRSGDTISLEGSLSRDVLQTESSVLFQPPDLQTVTELYPMVATLYEAGFRSFLGIPLISNNEIVGVLHLNAVRPDNFVQEHVAIAENVASQIGGAVANFRLNAALKLRDRERETLSSIGQIIGSSLDIKDVYVRFAREVNRILPMDRMSVGILTSDGKGIAHPYVWGQSPKSRRRGRIIPRGGTLADEALRLHKTIALVAREITDIEDQYPALVPLFDAGLRSYICVPLIRGDGASAIICYSSKEPDAYSQRDIDFAERVAAQILGAISNSELHIALQREARERAALAQIGQIASSTSDTNHIYREVAKRIKFLIPFDHFRVVLCDEENNELLSVYESGTGGVHDKLKGPFPFPRNGGCFEKIHRSENPYIFTPDDADLFFKQYPSLDVGFPSGHGSTLVVPLLDRGHIFGALVFRSFANNVYGEQDKVLSQRIAEHISGAIAMAHLNAALRIESAEKEALAEISRIINSSADISTVFDSFAASVKMIIPFDRLRVVLWNEGSNLRISAYESGLQVPAATLDPSNQQTAFLERLQKFRSGYIFNAETVEEFKELLPEADPEIFAGLKSTMILPLISEGSIIGELALRSMKSRAYSEHELEFAQRVADQIAGAIANSQLRVALQQEANERATLAEMGRIMGLSLDIDEVFDRFTDAVSQLIEFDLICITWINFADDTVAIGYQKGLNISSRTRGEVVPVAGTLVGASAIKGEVICAQNKSSKILIQEYPGLEPLSNKGLHSFISAPLTSGNEIVAAMIIATKRVNAYTSRQVELVDRVATQISGSVANSQLHAALQQEVNERTILAEIGRICGASLNVDEIYGPFTELLEQLIQFDNLEFTLLDPDAKQVNLVYCASPAPQGMYEHIGELPELHPHHGGLGQGTVKARILKSQSGLLIQAQDWEAVSAEYPVSPPAFESGFQSLIGVPLISKSKVVGFLFLLSRQRNAYTEKDLALVEHAASQVSGPIANASLYGALESTERSLRESEGITRAIADATPFPIVISGLRDGKVLYINNQMTTTFAVDPNTVVGRNSVEFYADPAMREAIISELKQGHPVRNKEIQMRHPDGTERWTELTIQPMTYNSEDAMLAVVNDVTQRKIAEIKINRMAREQALVSEIGRVVNSSLDMHQVYERLTEEVCKLIPFDRIVVSTVDFDNNCITQQYAGGTRTYRTAVTNHPIDGSLKGHVVRQGVGFRLEKNSSPDLVKNFPALRSSFANGLTSCMSVPLFSDGVIFGAVALYTTKELSYTDDDLDLLQRVGDQISSAISNAQLHADVRTEVKERTVLAKIGEIITSSTRIEEVYESLATEVRKLVPFDKMAIHTVMARENSLSLIFCTDAVKADNQCAESIRMDGFLAKNVISGQQSICVDDIAANPLGNGCPYLNGMLANGFRSKLLVPLIYRDEVIGIMNFLANAPHAFPPRIKSLAESIALQVSGAVATSELLEQVRASREDLRSLSNRIVEIQESERKYIANELHDEIGQILTGLKFTLEMIPKLGPESAHAQLWKAQQITNELLAQVRELALKLRPAVLDDLGLIHALLWHFDNYAKQTGVLIDFKQEGLFDRFSPEVELVAYRIIQEGLTNVARYADVKNATVDVRASDGHLNVEVMDRGSGFELGDLQSRAVGSGLAGMRERVTSIGGEFDILSSPGNGTVVSARLPVVNTQYSEEEASHSHGSFSR